MAEFEEKLNAILGDQQAMGQIMSLARSLTGGAPPQQRDEPQQSAREEPHQAEKAAPADLSALLGQLDPAMLQTGLRLFQEYQRDDGRSDALLAALRPYLKEDRRARLDQAMELARMTRLIRVALSAMGRGGSRTMYNRYIPDGASYTRVEQSAAPTGAVSSQKQAEERPAARQGGQSARGTETQRLGQESARNTGQGQPQRMGRDGLLFGLLHRFGAEQLDAGDVLLVLILLYLLMEGDDLEPVIALGLVLLMGLGGESGR